MENLARLKELRQVKGVTQKQAGEKIGIDQRQWNRYENNKNELPLRYFKAICVTFQVSADWLLGIEDAT